MRKVKGIAKSVQLNVRLVLAIAILLFSFLFSSVPKAGASGINFVSATSNQNNVASSLTLNVPTTTIPGDLLLASLDVEHQPTITAPAGWTLVRMDTNPNALQLRQAVYYHVATSNEPASYSWAFSASHGASGSIIDYSGVDSSQPVAASSGQYTANSITQINSPSVTTTQPNSLIVDITGEGVNRTLTPPSNLTTRASNETTTSGEKTQFIVADELLANAGASGNVQVSTGGSSVGIGELVALNPAPAADTTPPSTPTNVQQSTNTDTTISVTWSPSTDNVGVAGYTLYLNGAAVTTTTSTNYTFANLTCGQSYNLGVGAFDAAGNYSSEATISASTAPCVITPTTPTNLQESSDSQNSISVDWTPSSDSYGIAGYDLYENGSQVATTTNTSFTYANLSCGNTYNLGVEAFDNSGNVSSQATLNASTIACPSVQPPTATVSLSSNQPDTDDVLTATVSSQDPNNLPVTYTYVWQVNGVTMQTDTTSNSTDTYDLSVPGNGNYGDVITVQVTPSDSLSTGVVSTATATVTKPATGTILEYLVPTSAIPSGITSGPDGNLWFSLENSNQMGYVKPNGSFTMFTLPSTGNLGGINPGPDGNIWFCETTANKIAKITPSGTITEYPVPGASNNLAGIVEGSDGNMWFTETTGNVIGKITMNGAITLYPVPTASSSPHGLNLGPDGNIWFNEMSGDKIGKITPNGVFTEYKVPTTNARPSVIAQGADGNMWFAESNANKIGRITMTGTIIEFVIPTASSVPFGVTGGPDGNVWFTERSGNKIGRITPSGVITEYPISTANSQPDKIVTGSDGNLWFTQHGSDEIGRITP